MADFKRQLLAGISVIAFAAVQPGTGLAGDRGGPRPALLGEAQTSANRHGWTWWIEGGAARLDGDPGVAGMGNPPFDVYPNRWGWEAAVGVDNIPAFNNWFWSAQFRYGRNDDGSAANNPIAVFQGNGTTPAIAGNNSASRDEHRWIADFMVGRDFGLGQGQQVARFGVRIAEIRGETTGSARWNNVPGSGPINCGTAPSYCGSEVRDYVQENRFFGVGPRVELSGSAPLGGAWSFNYMGGAAALYGRRKVSQAVTVSNPTVPTFTPPAVLLSGGPVNARSSNNDWVFNLDALIGLSFAFSPNANVMLSYRFDGYWDALRGYDASGNIADLDRFYHGPMLRVTVSN